MKNYTVYFELFGKKLKTTVLAESEADAKRHIIDKITWHKVEVSESDEFNQSIEILDQIIDILGGKK